MLALDLYMPEFRIAYNTIMFCVFNITALALVNKIQFEKPLRHCEKAGNRIYVSFLQVSPKLHAHKLRILTKNMLFKKEMYRSMSYPAIGHKVLFDL